MSMACLYLGGKVENSPKSVRDVLMASCELRYPADARRLHQRVSRAGGGERPLLPSCCCLGESPTA